MVLTFLGHPAAFAQYFGWVGLSSVRSQYFENEDLLVYVPEPVDAFDSALATGDFDGNGDDDFVIGHPQRAVSGLPFAGAELVLYGSTFGDGFDLFADHFFWSAAVP